MNDDLKMIQLMLSDNMKYATHEKHYFTNAVSARSIRTELDLTEKDRPTTTEVTAKLVNRNNE